MNKLVMASLCALSASMFLAAAVLLYMEKTPSDLEKINHCATYVKTIY